MFASPWGAADSAGQVLQSLKAGQKQGCRAKGKLRWGRAHSCFSDLSWGIPEINARFQNRTDAICESVEAGVSGIRTISASVLPLLYLQTGDT